MPSITFNTTLGLIAGLIGLVVGLATMLLVWWQAPHQRNNQLMVLFMASVALWGLACLLLNLAVLDGWDASMFHRLLTFTIALNCYNTFVLAVRFAGLRATLVVNASLWFGLICLISVAPLIFSGQLVALEGVTEEGLFVYNLLPLSIPFAALLLLYYLGALGVIWRHRHGRAGRLLAGLLLIVGGIIFSLIPRLGAYPVDVLASAAASLLFARSILQEQLFGPLAQLNADLAASNAQLTVLSEGLQATADELRRARDAAEAASVAKSQFLANMSHELRTPLTSIIGYCDLIRMQLRDEGTINMADIEVIAQSGYHLLALINDVLDVARLETGKTTLDLSRFELAPVIRDLVQTIQPLVVKSGITLRVHCDAAAGAIVSDLTKLRQILLNLLSNALKFTHQGEIELLVSRELVNEVDLVIFQVADTGIGMTPEELDRLFQAFMQADVSMTRQYGGTGLGLALSQRLCQLMGGQITVRSEPGVGSTFVVTLPANLEHSRPGLWLSVGDAKPLL